MLDLANCPCAGETLDRLIQPEILATLMSGPLHGYGIAERIGEMSGFGGAKPDMSGVYRFLKSMETKGLVVSAWDTSKSGPAKKTYRITKTGEACLRTWISTLEEYRSRITHLLRAVRSSLDQNR
jgi:DNA-binding PadR family transcriptional regulator